MSESSRPSIKETEDRTTTVADQVATETTRQRSKTTKDIMETKGTGTTMTVATRTMEAEGTDKAMIETTDTATMGAEDHCFGIYDGNQTRTRMHPCTKA